MSDIFSFFEDDEDIRPEGLAPAVPAAPEAKAPTPPKTFAEQYKHAAADTKEVDTAKSDAARSKMWSGLIQGLSTALAGRDKTDSGFYNGLRQDADNKVKLAQDSHQQKLKGMLTDREVSSMMDSSSPFAGSLRTLVKAKGLEQVPADERTKFSEYVDKADATELQAIAKQMGLGSKSGSDRGTWQWKAVYDPQTQKTTYVKANTATGEEVPTDKIVGFSPKYDASTASLIPSTDPSAGAIPVMTADGGRLSDERTQIEGTRSRVRREGTIDANNEQEVAVADAMRRSISDIGEGAVTAHKAAYDKMQAGPIGGRVGDAQRWLGFSGGPEADKVRAEIGHMRADYQRALSGLTVSDAERRDIESRLPKIEQTPELFENNLKAFNDYMRRFVDQKRMQSGLPPAYGSGTEATATPTGPSDNVGSSGMTPEQRRQRIQELRSKMEQ